LNLLCPAPHTDSQVTSAWDYNKVYTSPSSFFQPGLGLAFSHNNNIVMELKDTGWEDIDQIHLAQVMGQYWALVNMVINFYVPEDREFLY
jgi:hypothetical protein